MMEEMIATIRIMKYLKVPLKYVTGKIIIAMALPMKDVRYQQDAGIMF